MDSGDSRIEGPVGRRSGTPNNFSLVYEGPDVRDGTMNAGQLAEVLTGLGHAYSTVAYEADLGGHVQLRVVGIERKSFHIILDAIDYAKANPPAATAIAAGSAVTLNALSNVISGVYRVISDIAKVIDAKKRAKGARVSTLPTSFAEKGVTLTVHEDSILLTKEQYELLLSRQIDHPLSQMVSPLAPNRIDTFKIRMAQEDLVTIDADQRKYFDVAEVTEDKSREGTEIDGVLNSLTKTSLRGTFYTLDGVHVPYKYIGGDVATLLRGFISREPLRVRGRIKYGSDGLPAFVEVQNIEILQQGIFER